MIHEAFTRSQVAFRYYKGKNPERKYTIEAAKKQFNQDVNIDLKIIRKVILRIFAEQKELLKKAA